MEKFKIEVLVKDGLSQLQGTCRFFIWIFFERIDSATGIALNAQTGILNISHSLRTIRDVKEHTQLVCIAFLFVKGALLMFFLRSRT